MKHINEFEEFNPDDFPDLESGILDLGSMGFKERLMKGIDFGFGPDLKGQNDGKTLLFLTPEAYDFLGKTDFFYKTPGFIKHERWPEYKGISYEDRVVKPGQVQKSEGIRTLEYPPVMDGNVRVEGIPVQGLYFIPLSDTRSGRYFPTMFFTSSRSRFISPKKVAPTYDIITKHLEEARIKR